MNVAELAVAVRVGTAPGSIGLDVRAVGLAHSGGPITTVPCAERVPQRDRGLQGSQNRVLVSSVLALPPSRARGVDAAKTTWRIPPLGAGVSTLTNLTLLG